MIIDWENDDVPLRGLWGIEDAEGNDLPAHTVRFDTISGKGIRLTGAVNEIDGTLDREEFYLEPPFVAFRRNFSEHVSVNVRVDRILAIVGRTKCYNSTRSVGASLQLNDDESHGHNFSDFDFVCYDCGMKLSDYGNAPSKCTGVVSTLDRIVSVRAVSEVMPGGVIGYAEFNPSREQAESLMAHERGSFISRPGVGRWVTREDGPRYAIGGHEFLDADKECVFCGTLYTQWLAVRDRCAGARFYPVNGDPEPLKPLKKSAEPRYHNVKPKRRIKLRRSPDD